MGTYRDGYILELNDEDLETARTELGEDPAQVQSHITTLREWLKEQKHFTTRQDDEFLLMFLRQAKFSQIRARKKLEAYTRNRVTAPTDIVYINSSKIDDKTIELLQLGVAFPLPRVDKSGIRVFMFRPGLVDSSKHTMFDVARLCLLNVELILIDPVTQIHGIQYIVDHDSVSFSYFTLFTPRAMQVCATTLASTVPARYKMAHIYKAPTVVSGVLALFKSFVSEKIGSRLQNHWNDVKALHARIDSSILPEELGGTAGTYTQLATQWMKYVESHRNQLDRSSCFSYDQSHKPDGGDITESFRKLDIE